MYEGSGSDMNEGTLAVNNYLPPGTNCQWLITSPNENEFVTLEFQHLDVISSCKS